MTSPPRGPWSWLRLFGPGAIIASLTIGTGELIFSSRAGAIFGFDILWVFLAISVLKWALVLATARHIVLSGAHPFERWTAIPGPRGWLPAVFLVLAVGMYPIWIGFHGGVLGTLLAWCSGTEKYLDGAGHQLWAAGIVFLMTLLALAGGYRALERVQLTVVALMVLGVSVSLVLLQPAWGGLLRGVFVPGRLSYPPWIPASVAARPAWVEVATYVGVVGGASYDYLAYVSYLRQKRWGRAGGSPATADELDEVARDPRHPSRQWLRAPLVDCSLSFLAVLLVSLVFVACGATVLLPAQKVPAGTTLLTLQRDFVEPLPWFQHLYIPGAILAMLGTLYGTIEVAPAVLQEIVRALSPSAFGRHETQLRRAAILWCGLGGLAVVAWNIAVKVDLIALITPASLFTGVFSCGLVCLWSLWADWRFLPRGLRMGWPLALLNALAAVVFLAVGIKGYRDKAAQAADGEWFWGAMTWLAIAFVACNILIWSVDLTRRRHSSS